MTAATDETTTRRTGSARPRALESSRRDLGEVRQHTEAAVSDLLGATAEAVRALVPSAVLRPTEAVEYAFDVAEQVLTGTRRVCVEVAGVLQGGLESPVRRAAA